MATDLSQFSLTPEEIAELTPQQQSASKPKKRTHPVEDRYVQMTATGAQAGAQALACPMYLVWYEILYLVWKNRSMTVELPNTSLAKRGVSRWTKYRALAHFEDAKLISVNQRGRKTPIITLLKSGCVVFKSKSGDDIA